MWIKTERGLFNFEKGRTITRDGYDVWFQNETDKVSAHFETIRDAQYFLYKIGLMLGAK